MDGTSSNHRLSSTLPNEIDSIITDQTQKDKPSGIVSVSYQRNFTSSLTSSQRLTPSAHPKRAPNTYVNINRLKLGDQQNTYKEKEFSKIRSDTEHIYDALRNFERSAIRYHAKYDTTQNDANLNKDWNKFKSIRNELLINPSEINSQNNLQTRQEYKDLVGTRNASNLETFLSDSPLSSKLDPLTGAFRDPATGLFAELKSVGGGKYALCIGSTGVGRMTMKQTKVDIAQVLNQRKVPAAYKQAVELTKVLHNVLKQQMQDEWNRLEIEGTVQDSDLIFTVTGQSMGGGIANYVGLKLGIQSNCFNPAALGQAAIKDLKDSGRLTPENLNKQKIIRQKGDIISGEKNQKKIAQFANIFIPNVDTPQHLGQIYVAKKTDIPSLNGVTRGFQSRHFTSSFQPFYDYSNTQAAQPDTASEKSTISSESSSVGSPSGGE